MYRCSRCGQYFVPGYLECACRTTARQDHLHTRQVAVPAQQDPAEAIPSRNAEGPSQQKNLSDKYLAQGHEA